MRKHEKYHELQLVLVEWWLNNKPSKKRVRDDKGGADEEEAEEPTFFEFTQMLGV